MIWCDMVWYGEIWYDVVLRGVMWCGVLWRDIYNICYFKETDLMFIFVYRMLGFRSRFWKYTLEFS